MNVSKKPVLSPGGQKAKAALAEANKIVAESNIGQFLLEKKDSPEGYANLVGKVLDVIVDTNE